MPIPTTIDQLSQTAASNYPIGSDSPSTLDDTQRAHASFIALLRDGKGLTNTATVASSTTTDIGGQNSQFVEVTGTTTITSFGSTYNGPRYVRFTGVLTLTHNATTLNIYGGLSVTTSANYMVVAIPNAALNGWNVWPIGGASGSFAASGANNDITSLSALTSIPNGTVTNLPSVSSAFKNLQASSTGLSANVSVSADEIVLENGSNQFVTLRSVSLTIAGTTTGANALDTGSIAASTWYSVWVIWNGTTAAGLLSLSATAPTMPSGYTHKARVGWVRTDGTANKFPLGFKQFGRRVQYVVASGSNVTGLLNMASGAAGSPGTPTWVAVGVSNFVPTTASQILGFALLTGSGTASSGIIVAPSNAYGAYGSTSNSPPVIATQAYGSGIGGTNFAMILESTNIYWSSNGTISNNLYCLGWEDNL